MAITSMTNPAINTLSNLEVRVVGTSLAVDFDIPSDTDFDFVRVYLGDSNLDTTILSTIDYRYDTRESGTLKATPFVAGMTKKIIMEVYDTLGAGSQITTFLHSGNASATQVTFQAANAGAAGADSIDVNIMSSAGTVFKNDVGETALTAQVSIGGNIVTTPATYNTYIYVWEVDTGSDATSGVACVVDDNKNSVVGTAEITFTTGVGNGGTDAINRNACRSVGGFWGGDDGSGTRSDTTCFSVADISDSTVISDTTGCEFDNSSRADSQLFNGNLGFSADEQIFRQITVDAAGDVNDIAQFTCTVSNI